MTIPPGVEAIVRAQWRACPTWQEPSGLVEQLAGRTIPGLAMGHTLVNTDEHVVAIRVINTRTEPHTIGWGIKVADCTSVINVVDVRDTNVWPVWPQGGLSSILRIGPIPFVR